MSAARTVCFEVKVKLVIWTSRALFINTYMHDFKITASFCIILVVCVCSSIRLSSEGGQSNSPQTTGTRV